MAAAGAPEPVAGICGTDLIIDGWFMEKNKQWPGQATSLQVDKVLLHEKTEWQDLLVFQSTDWGKVLVLDGVIQLTERDEMSYQEMMAHLPLFAHQNPKEILIVGGGDGGVLREVVKHDCVEHVTHYDIDAGVVEAAQQFFPSLSAAYDHPKSKTTIGDGVGYVMSAKENSFDVIIIDSSDPVGPAEKLFSKEFYADVLRILKPGGVVCSQGECLWVHADIILALQEFCEGFASVEYASIQTPTYPSGQIGALLARKAHSADDTSKSASCRRLARIVPADMKLDYYSEDMHSAAFALPAFLARKLLKAGGESATKKPRLSWSA